MLTVPLVALIGLYAFALASVVKPVLDLSTSGVADRDVRTPGKAAVAALQAERKANELYLASDKVDDSSLRAARSATDAAVAKLRRSLQGSSLRRSDEQTARRIDDALKALDTLPAARQQAEASPDRASARSFFTTLVWAIFTLFDGLPASVTPQATREQSGDTAVARLADQLSEEDAVIAGLNVARRYTPADMVLFIKLIGAEDNQVSQATSLLVGDLKSEVERLLGGTVAQRLYGINKVIIAKGINGGLPPVDTATWEAIYHPGIALVLAFHDQVRHDVDRYIKNAANGARLQLALTGLGGFLVVVLSLLLAIRLGRSLAVRLGGLRASALDLADVRLPSVVSRLRRGEMVDAALEAPPLNLGADEIGEVGEAFNRVRRTAIEAAVEEATLRQSINQFFVNIARRSQSLLHRQLALLDNMERRTTEPEELADLFRVDHLATRMRRHAEDLVILAGNAPGRGWRQPVPMVDVIRGAISEIEDYARVKLSVLGEEALIGPAVGDIAHLLAELIENGTHYSPPMTPVLVTGQAVGNGFAVEIEDRGLGMTPEALDETNRRLLDPPDFDLADSAQLGLFVVARLAAKHGVRVQLRQSIFGGISAVVLIPTDLIVPADEIGNAPQLPAHAAVTQQLPELVVAGQHRVDAGAQPAPDGGGTGVEPTADGGAAAGAGPGQHAPFDWLRSRTPAAPPAEARAEALRPATSADRTETPPPATIRAAVPVQSASPDAPPRVPTPAPAEAAAGAAAGPPTPVAAPAGTAPRLPRPRSLPRRIRQASLAPQLKNAAASILDADQASPTPSPELIRTRMSSFQAGMNRGRRAGATQTGQEDYQ